MVYRDPGRRPAGREAGGGDDVQVETRIANRDAKSCVSTGGIPRVTYITQLTLAFFSLTRVKSTQLFLQAE